MDAPTPLERFDLSHDPGAVWVVKDETVDVRFARESGVLQSLEGPNRYAAGDAIVTASTGEAWVVSADRFALAYRALGVSDGEDGPYRNVPVRVLARRMDRPFAVRRRPDGDVLNGRAGDWLMQYAPGVFGITAAERFGRVYRMAPDSGTGDVTTSV